MKRIIKILINLIAFITMPLWLAIIGVLLWFGTPFLAIIRKEEREKLKEICLGKRWLIDFV